MLWLQSASALRALRQLRPHQEHVLCKQGPVLQVRDAVRAHIAGGSGCMSGRGAMDGAGCGIACKRSIMRLHTLRGGEWTSAGGIPLP